MKTRRMKTKAKALLLTSEEVHYARMSLWWAVLCALNLEAATVGIVHPEFSTGAGMTVHWIIVGVNVVCVLFCGGLVVWNGRHWWAERRERMVQWDVIKEIILEVGRNG